jgi:hypothetical protein
MHGAHATAGHLGGARSVRPQVSDWRVDGCVLLHGSAREATVHGATVAVHVVGQVRLHVACGGKGGQRGRVVCCSTARIQRPCHLELRHVVGTPSWTAVRGAVLHHWLNARVAANLAKLREHETMQLAGSQRCGGPGCGVCLYLPLRAVLLIVAILVRLAAERLSILRLQLQVGWLLEDRILRPEAPSLLSRGRVRLRARDAGPGRNMMWPQVQRGVHPHRCV